MKLSRRNFLHLGTGLAALPGLPHIARAQTYPSRPVRLMVGFAAGQAIDILARLVGQALSERLGQQFIIENRPGAGGNIVTEAVVRAAPDGYTFLVVGANNAINASLYDNLNFNMLRDIVPVAGIYRVPQVMEVNPCIPGPHRSGVHCLREGQSGQDQLRLGGQRVGCARDRRIFQDDDRHRYAAHPLSRAHRRH